VLQGHSQDVKFVMFHPVESSLLYSCGYDDTIKVWREEGDDWYCLETLKGHQSTVWSLCLNSSGNLLISCSADLSLICWQSVGESSAPGWMKSSTLPNAHKYPIYRYTTTPLT
jgi:cytosolic iron-sulfur protein assembly protein CIAO1